MLCCANNVYINTIDNLGAIRFIFHTNMSYNGYYDSSPRYIVEVVFTSDIYNIDGMVIYEDMTNNKEMYIDKVESNMTFFIDIVRNRIMNNIH